MSRGGNRDGAMLLGNNGQARIVDGIMLGADPEDIFIIHSLMG
jgi:hypothetical protein